MSVPDEGELDDDVWVAAVHGGVAQLDTLHLEVEQGDVSEHLACKCAVPC